MNKRALCFALVLFGLSFASAISTDLREGYSPSETILVRIWGNILEPLTANNFVIKKLNVEIPVEHDLKRFGEDYYLWFIAPAEGENYTMHINNIATTISGVQKEINFAQNFSVEKNATSYNVNPGFFITSGNIEFEVFSFADEKTRINTNLAGAELELSPGTNKFKFNLEAEREDRISYISIGDYSLPAYIYGDKNALPSAGENKTIIIYDEPRIIPSKISSIWYRKERPMFSFEVANPTNRRIENAYFEYDDRHLSITPEEKTSFGRNESRFFNVSFISINESLYTTVNLLYEGKRIPLDIELNLTEDAAMAGTKYSENSSNSGAARLPKCWELLGKVCERGYECSSPTVPSTDGACCTQLCKQKQSTTSYAWIGYLIAAAVIGIGIYLWYRYKKTGPEKGIFERKIKEAEPKREIA